MKLPKYEQIIVDKTGLERLLRDAEHEQAAFFLKFGFSADHAEVLAQALQAHVAEFDVTETTAVTDGVTYVIEGVLPTPDGRDPRVRSYWRVDAEGDTPRFLRAALLK